MFANGLLHALGLPVERERVARRQLELRRARPGSPSTTSPSERPCDVRRDGDLALRGSSRSIALRPVAALDLRDVARAAEPAAARERRHGQRARASSSVGAVLGRRRTRMSTLVARPGGACRPRRPRSRCAASCATGADADAAGRRRARGRSRRCSSGCPGGSSCPTSRRRRGVRLQRPRDLLRAAAERRRSRSPRT